uniref:DNA repair nuclease/redox regulator APEX1 n=1 Tax=Anas platyrhynchos platyrhynchos TaxID=8840 RepID=A0A493SY61_ANAPP
MGFMGFGVYLWDFGVFMGFGIFMGFGVFIGFGLFLGFGTFWGNFWDCFWTTSIRLFPGVPPRPFWVNFGRFWGQWVQEEAPDVLCLQETKCAAPAVPPEIRALSGLPHQFWASPEGRPGYSGVGLLARQEPLSVTYGIGDPEHDSEGRVVTAEFPALYVVAAYVPNSGRGLVRLPYRQRWDRAFRSFLANLDARKPVAVCGDLNVAHAEIDLRHPRANRKSPGFTDEEREGFGELLGLGFLDTFRHLYPAVPHAYTFWTYLGGARGRNVGWRLDYCLLSQRLEGALCD